jgi:hypothetical protein
LDHVTPGELDTHLVTTAVGVELPLDGDSRLFRRYPVLEPEKERRGRRR